MSKLPGRIERVVEAVFIANPNNAFSTEDLCDRIHGNRIDRHRESIIRAAKKVCTRIADWTYWESEQRGGMLVFFNHASVMSYALGRGKIESWYIDEKHIRADLAPGGRQHHLIVEGGAWWQFVQMYLDQRD